MSRETLKSLLNNLINDNAEAAAADLHSYLSTKLSAASGIVEAVGDKTKIDSISLSYLDTAYNAIVKGKGYSDQLKRQAAFIYSKLKPAARRGDSEEFQQIWHELMADKPDAMAEFADEMFAAAGLGHRGTFDKLAKKIGLTEATNRQHELAREAYRKFAKYFDIKYQYAVDFFEPGDGAPHFVFEKAKKEGWDDGATTFGENAAFFKKVGISKAEFNAIIARCEEGEEVEGAVISEMADSHKFSSGCLKSRNFLRLKV